MPPQLNDAQQETVRRACCTYNMALTLYLKINEFRYMAETDRREKVDFKTCLAMIDNVWLRDVLHETRTPQ